MVKSKYSTTTGSTVNTRYSWDDFEDDIKEGYEDIENSIDDASTEDVLNALTAGSMTGAGSLAEEANIIGEGGGGDGPGPTPPAVTPPTPMPIAEKPGQIRQKNARSRKRRRGRESTMLTTLSNNDTLG